MEETKPVIGEMKGFRSIVDWVNGQPQNAFQIPRKYELIPEEGPPRVWLGKEWLYL